MMQSNGSPIGIAAGLIKMAHDVTDGLPALVNYITFGSFTLESRKGNEGEVYWFDEKTQSSINAIGLKNLGLEAFLRDELPKVFWLKDLGCKIRVSLSPLKSGDLEKMIVLLWEYADVASHIDEIEVNAACPNHRDEAGRLHEVLAHDPVALKALMEEARHRTHSPMAIKIAPRMSEKNLIDVVDLAIKYKFESIVSGNTLLSSATIDGAKRLSVDRGGMGGTLLFQYAVRQAHMLRNIIDNRCNSATKPLLIACGGVMSPDDVRQHQHAGADGTVQIATYFAQYREKGVRDLVQHLI